MSSGDELTSSERLRSLARRAQLEAAPMAAGRLVAPPRPCHIPSPTPDDADRIVQTHPLSDTCQTHYDVALHTMNCKLQRAAAFTRTPDLGRHNARGCCSAAGGAWLGGRRLRGAQQKGPSGPSGACRRSSLVLCTILQVRCDRRAHTFACSRSRRAERSQQRSAAARDFGHGTGGRGAVPGAGRSAGARRRARRRRCGAGGRRRWR